MMTLQQASFLSKKIRNKSSRSKLNNNPQQKAICLKLLTLSPKKPNSANRRVAKIRLINNKYKIMAKIPGENHNLQQHSIVLICGAKVRDLIGVSYSDIRGKFDLLGVSNRKTKRSSYGVKKV
jgi:small subunit ribosomal protein S12